MRFLQALASFALAIAAQLGTSDGAQMPRGTWPLAAPHPVVRPFDPPSLTWGRGHRGVDLRGRLGSPVRSALPGRVSFVGKIAGKAVVVVTHGQLRTTYEPVRASVAKGDHVTAGQVIGTMQARGGHCLPGYCLHWGLIRGRQYLNPLLLVVRQIRLLPL